MQKIEEKNFNKKIFIRDINAKFKRLKKIIKKKTHDLSGAFRLYKKQFKYDLI